MAHIVYSVNDKICIQPLSIYWSVLEKKEFLPTIILSYVPTSWHFFFFLFGALLPCEVCCYFYSFQEGCFLFTTPAFQITCSLSKNHIILKKLILRGKNYIKSLIEHDMLYMVDLVDIN